MVVPAVSQATERIAPKTTPVRPVKNTVKKEEYSEKTPAVTKSITRPSTVGLKAGDYYRRAIEQLNLSQVQAAIPNLQESLRLDPELDVARELLASLLFRGGRNAEARIILKEGIALNPRHIAFSKLYAHSMIEQGSLAEARQVLEQNLIYAANSTEYLSLLAAVSQRLSDHKSAVAYYMQALEIDNNDGAWWVGMGISLDALGRKVEASHAYQAAKNRPGLSADVIAYVDSRLQDLKK